MNKFLNVIKLVLFKLKLFFFKMHIFTIFKVIKDLVSFDFYKEQVLMLIILEFDLLNEIH